MSPQLTKTNPHQTSPTRVFRSSSSSFFRLLLGSTVFFLVFPTSTIGQSIQTPELTNFPPIVVVSTAQPAAPASSRPSFHYANERRPSAASSSPAFELSERRQHAQLVAQAAEGEPLPSCSSIPRLLCCTTRVLAKCYEGCVEHVRERCAHKLRQVEPSATPPPQAAEDEDLLDERHRHSTVAVQPTGPPLTRSTAGRRPNTRPSPTAQPYVIDRDIDPPAAGGSFEPLVPEPTAASVPASSTQQPHRAADSREMAAMLREQTPASNRSTPFDSFGRGREDECGTARSRPPFLPCHPRRLTDGLFAACCEQQVPAECRSLCTYEHREQVAAEAMIRAVQQDGCDLKWLSAILSCAHQDRDNRACCRHLGLAGEELGVGERCLRMCAVGESSGHPTVGVVEQSDLVCLSNWNVIMYCARAGLRSF